MIKAHNTYIQILCLNLVAALISETFKIKKELLCYRPGQNYIGMTVAVKETTYLRLFLIKLGLKHLLAKNTTFHARSKHIRVDIKLFHKNTLKDKLLTLKYVLTTKY